MIKTLVAVDSRACCQRLYEFGVVSFNDAMTTRVAMIQINKKARTDYLSILKASSTMFLDIGMGR